MFRCDRCGIEFTRRDSQTRHQRKCRGAALSPSATIREVLSDGDLIHAQTTSSFPPSSGTRQAEMTPSGSEGSEAYAGQHGPPTACFANGESGTLNIGGAHSEGSAIRVGSAIHTPNSFRAGVFEMNAVDNQISTALPSSYCDPSQSNPSSDSCTDQTSSDVAWSYGPLAM